MHEQILETAREPRVPTRGELEACASKPDEESLRLHAFYQGKMQVVPKCPISDARDFAYWYTPGVAAPCRAIQADPSRVYELTNKANLIAIVSDGSRVLGLGNIGLTPVFRSWKARRGKRIDSIRIAMIGMGAANVATYRILKAYGIYPAQIIACDSQGTVHRNRGDLEERPGRVRRELGGVPRKQPRSSDWWDRTSAPRGRCVHRVRSFGPETDPPGVDPCHG
ncbi:MAG: hypothetical protein ABSG13_30015 [Bryobacteraceae bacterium]|jgi:malic enzyme